jgi:predicted nucleic acid-binding protein
VTDFVLDNSVTMRWCFDAGAHPYADHVLERLETSAGEAFVPVLWRYEVSSVLARAQIKGFLPAHKGATFLVSLADLAINVDPDSAGHVLTRVHKLAIQYRLTSYDAAYLELAQRRNLSMATLDDELRAACRSAGVGLL